MTQYGYTLMTEQSGPRELVSYAQDAERIGFDFLVSSDHFSPWLTEQGHAPYAWTVLGAVAQATSRVELMTFVTCPTVRYHPAVVAQKAATLGVLSEGRFTLGVGSGESLNEHVVGVGWPGVQTRQEMLAEAIEIIRELHTGELVDHKGTYFDVESARIWDLPDEPVQIGVAVAGTRGIGALAPLADHLIAVEPSADLVEEWNGTEGAPRVGDRARAIGQVPICWAPTEEEAVALAHEQFRWFGGAGASTPTCRRRPASTRPASSSGRRTSRDRSPAVPTSTSWPRRSSPTRERASPTSRCSRSVTATRSSSSTRSPDRSSSASAPPERSRRRAGCVLRHTRPGAAHRGGSR